MFNPNVYALGCLNEVYTILANTHETDLLITNIFNANLVLVPSNTPEIHTVLCIWLTFDLNLILDLLFHVLAKRVEDLYWFHSEEMCKSGIKWPLANNPNVNWDPVTQTTSGRWFCRLSIFMLIDDRLPCSPYCESWSTQTPTPRHHLPSGGISCKVSEKKPQHYFLLLLYLLINLQSYDHMH